MPRPQSAHMYCNVAAGDRLPVYTFRVVDTYKSLDAVLALVRERMARRPDADHSASILAACRLVSPWHILLLQRLDCGRGRGRGNRTLTLLRFFADCAALVVRACCTPGMQRLVLDTFARPWPALTRDTLLLIGVPARTADKYLRATPPGLAVPLLYFLDFCGDGLDCCSVSLLEAIADRVRGTPYGYFWLEAVSAKAPWVRDVVCRREAAGFALTPLMVMSVMYDERKLAPVARHLVDLDNLEGLDLLARAFVLHNSALIAEVRAAVAAVEAPSDAALALVDGWLGAQDAE
jgi:hypothetical protein